MSKKKRRYQEDGFDLDLSCLFLKIRKILVETVSINKHSPFLFLLFTNIKKDIGQTRLIAMGFPSESLESAYRNPYKEVKR